MVIIWPMCAGTLMVDPSSLGVQVVVGRGKFDMLRERKQHDEMAIEEFLLCPDQEVSCNQGWFVCNALRCPGRGSLYLLYNP